MDYRKTFLTPFLALACSAFMAGAVAYTGTSAPTPPLKAVWTHSHLGNVYITVDGSNLGDATQVIIGDLVAKFRIKDGEIRAVVPTYAVSGQVVVTTPEGKAASRPWVGGPPPGGVAENE